MAVRHEFGGEKHPNEPSEGKSMQNPPNSKLGPPDNIDSLVSRFLDELSNISSGIDEGGSPATSSETGAEGDKNRAGIPLRLPEEAVPAADSELEKIDDEIERSLAELESLTSEPVASERNLVPEGTVKAAAPLESPIIKAKIESAARAARIDSEEQTWNRMELFKQEIAASHRRRQMIGWILAGAGLIVILGVAGFYFSSSNKKVPEGAAKTTKIELAKPAQTPDDTQQPVVSEKSTNITAAPQNGKPVDVPKPAAQETRAKPMSGSVRNANTGNNRTPGTSAAVQKPIQPGPNGNGTAPAGKPRITEESPRQGPPQAAVAIPSPPEQPSAAANPASAASQPKPNPTTPSGTANNNNGNLTAAPVAASIPEPPPAALKTAPAVDPEAGNAASQPKARTVVMSEAISKVPPVYPPIARSQKVSGKVDVDVDVSEKGDVIRAKAVSGPELLRPAAEQALMKWKFKPASVDGANVPSKARIQVTFNVQQ